eukprot:TRINITY_DN61813_c0_g1_i1.p1 TRINITY_DN61813_c0_g1~~TRINITY_DN61813_c0_g1_i1.p1  ORF type:complete len:661 (-),score=46.17 TRINITY_DN61813_c0_g1_i1:516-2498(-)
MFAPHPEKKIKDVIMQSLKTILNSSEPQLTDPKALLKYLNGIDRHFPQPAGAPDTGQPWDSEYFYMDSPKYIKPTAMGVTLTDDTSSGLLLVSSVCEGGWAEQTLCVEADDAILIFNGKQHPTKRDVTQWWATSVPGERCHLTVSRRSGEQSHLSVANTVLMRRTIITVSVHKHGTIEVNIDKSCGPICHGDELILDEKKHKVKIYVGMSNANDDQAIVYDPEKNEYQIWKHKGKVSKGKTTRVFDKSYLLTEAQVHVRRLLHLCHVSPTQLYQLQMDCYQAAAFQALDDVIPELQAAHPTLDPAVVESMATKAAMEGLKAGQTLAEVVAEVNAIIDFNATSLPSTKVSVARVIDFLGSPQAHQVVTQLQQLGFYVKPTLNSIQRGPRCGYIAAKVATEMYKAGSGKWLQVDLTRTTYDSVVQEGNKILQQNDPNFRPPNLNTPVWLTATQIECLVKHWYGSHLSLWFDGALSLNYFKDGVVERKRSGHPYAGRICIVNTCEARLGDDRNKGVHWFVVGYSINSDRLREDDELSVVSSPTSFDTGMYFPPSESYDPESPNPVRHSTTRTHPPSSPPVPGFGFGLTVHNSSVGGSSSSSSTSVGATPGPSPSHSAGSSSPISPNRNQLIKQISGRLDVLDTDDLNDVLALVEQKVRSLQTV